MAAQIPVKASTQEHLDIADIVDDLVILKNGNVALILQTTAINFGLLSESEQDATIFAYAGLLNSLSFPVQIVIRSKRSDISTYIKLLKQQEERQNNPDLKNQIRKYREFIEATVQQNQVLDKSFYFVIPFSVMQIGTTGAISALTTKGKKLPYTKDYILQQAKTNLYPKRDHLIKQLNRLGLSARQLTTQELVELFYDIYNPTEVASEKVAVDVKEYTAPMVAPAIETSKPSSASSLAYHQQLEKFKAQQETPQAIMPKQQRVTSQQLSPQEALQQKMQAQPQAPPEASQTTKASYNQQEALKALQEAMAKAQELLKKSSPNTPANPQGPNENRGG